MTTKITDLVDVEELTEAVSARFAAGVNALWGTGAAVANDSFPGGPDAVGTKVKVPYFGSVGEWESLSDGSAFTPTKITQTEEEATVHRIGKAFSITDWARMAGAKGEGNKDPYDEAADQCMAGFEGAVDRMLILACVASLPAMTVDVYSATTPRTIDSDLIIDGRAKWGDEAGARALLMAHSKVENDMWKLKDATGRNLLVSPQTGGLSTFVGYPVGMSDRLAAAAGITPAKYTTVLANPGAVVCWYNGKPMVETGRDILAGADVVVVSTYAVVHRYKRLPGKTKPGVALLVHN
jgi:hypothetical protein